MNDQRNWPSDPVENPAFNALFQLEKPFFQSVCRQLSMRLAKMNVPPCDRDDLIDEALLRAVKHRRRFVGSDLERRLCCWLKRTVHRLALDRARQRAKHTCEALDVKTKELIDEGETKRAAMGETSEQVKALLGKAGSGNEPSVRLLLGHFFHGHSISELAQHFGMTEDAINGRIRRLLKKLRELAEEILPS